MRRNWLLYLVIFSLALNLGIIGTFAYLHYQNQPDQAVVAAPPMPSGALWHQINLDNSQRQTIQSLFPEHRRKIQEIRLQMAEKRQELFDLLRNDSPASAIQAKVREINALQGSLEQEMVRFMLAFKKTLTPQQRVVFLNRVQSHLCGPEACRMGPGFGRHRGMGRGMGMGPGMGPRRMPPQESPSK